MYIYIYIYIHIHIYIYIERERCVYTYIYTYTSLRGSSCMRARAVTSRSTLRAARCTIRKDPKGVSLRGGQISYVALPCTTANIQTCFFHQFLGECLVMRPLVRENPVIN